MVAKQRGTSILRTGYKKYECGIEEAIDITNARRGKVFVPHMLDLPKSRKKSFTFKTFQ